MPRQIAKWILVLVLTGPGLIFAQTSQVRWMASLSGSFLDYRGLLDKDFTQFDTYAPGITMGAYGYATPWMNASLVSSFAPEVLYPIGPRESINSSLVDVNAMVQFKSNGSFLKETSVLAPYLAVGMGVNVASSRTGIYLPAALGLRIQVTKSFSFQLESMYKQRLNTQYQHLQHSVGLVFAVSQPRPVKKTEPAPKPQRQAPVVAEASAKTPPKTDPKTDPKADRDNDGIPDKEDICPDQRGLALYMGCPNKESVEQAQSQGREGLAEQPAAPVVPEPAPKPVAPIKDLAATQPNSLVSRSETSPYDVSLLEGAMQKIYFDENSTTLRKDAYAILDHVAQIMQRYPEYQLEVLGHTDNSGDSRERLVVSIQRAFNVKYYLVHEKGIKLARISSDGYSDLAPDGDNATSEGRSANRRVEFRLIKMPVTPTE
jgi:outer membrane protein OmpA-like peptidoglycan-associated protein